MTTGGKRFGVLLLVGLLALGASGCGGKKKKKEEDPVATAIMEPGVRTLVIPRQRNDVTIVVTPCTAAAAQQGSVKRKPPGSNEIVVPRSTLRQTVAVPPCPMKPTEAAANTVLVSPGGSGPTAEEQSSSAPMNQLVLPSNSNIETVILPPCTMATTGSAPPPKSLAFPAGSEKKKTVTAPPCTATSS